MIAPVSKLRFIALALALSAIPVITVLKAAHRQHTGTPIHLSVNLDLSKRSAVVPALDVKSDLHTLNPNDLSGDDNFEIGRPAFVFLKYSGGDIWYPFAILNKRPDQFIAKDDTVMLMGFVTATNAQEITLSYDFDRISPPAALERQMRIQYNEDIKLGLSVTPDGRSAVTDIYINGVRFDQRIIPKLALRGGKKIAANIAPPT